MLHVIQKHKGFAFVPDDKPPRIVRFVDGLGDGVVARYHSASNVLRVSKALFATLSKQQQEGVLRTQEDCVVLDDWFGWPEAAG